MTLTKDVAGLAVGVGALNLVTDSVKDMNKSLKMKSSPTKNIVKSSTKLMIGSALIGASSDIVNKL